MKVYLHSRIKNNFIEFKTLLRMINCTWDRCWQRILNSHIHTHQSHNICHSYFDINTTSNVKYVIKNINFQIQNPTNVYYHGIIPKSLIFLLYLVNDAEISRKRVIKVHCMLVIYIVAFKAHLKKKKKKNRYHIKDNLS